MIFYILLSLIGNVISKNYCDSDACGLYHDRLNSWLNTTIDPCDDFHEFSCGGFEDIYKDQKEFLGTNAIQITRNNLLENITNWISQIEHLKNISPLQKSDLSKLSEFFNGCNNEPNFNAESKQSEHLVKFLDNFCDAYLPISYENSYNKTAFGNALGNMHVHGTHVFFELEIFVESSDKQPRFSIKIDDLSRLMKLKFDQKRNSLSNIVKKISNFFTLNGPEYMHKAIFNGTFDDLAVQIFDFQSNLIKIYEKFENTTTDPFQEFVVLGDGILKSFDFNELINVKFPPHLYSKFPKEPPLVFLNGFYLLKKIDSLIKSTNPLIVEAYMIWANYIYIVSSIEMDLNNSAMQSFDLIFLRRKEQCIWTVTNYFGEMISFYYLSNLKKPRQHLQVEAMLTSLKLAFSDHISHLDWLDDNTKESALQKLRHIKANIGHPKKVSNYNSVHALYKEINITDNFYTNLQNLRAMKSMSIDRKLVDKKYFHTWNMSPLAVNAYYESFTNEIFIPEGILQSPMFDIDLPLYSNFGSLGFILGHELIHAFDSQGSTRNFKGELENWWSNATSQLFSNKTECIENQYNQYTINWKNSSQNINGKLTLNENIADNGGISIAYQAWNYYSKLTGLGPLMNKEINEMKWTNDQLFYISFAQMWCHVPDTNEFGADYMKFGRDVHSPDKYRVNGALSNSEHFSKIFKCELGKKMNPIDKCIVW